VAAVVGADVVVLLPETDPAVVGALVEADVVALLPELVAAVVGADVVVLLPETDPAVVAALVGADVVASKPLSLNEWSNVTISSKPSGMLLCHVILIHPALASSFRSISIGSKSL
jgi:hypothetical protein